MRKKKKSPQDRNDSSWPGRTELANERLERAVMASWGPPECAALYIYNARTATTTTTTTPRHNIGYEFNKKHNISAPQIQDW